MKKLVSIVLLLVLVLTLSVPVFAESEAEIPTPAPPAQGFYDYGGGEPLGTYTPEELQEIRRLAEQPCQECPQGRHFSPMVHVHKVTAITNSYVGKIEKGIVASVKPTNTTSRLSFSRGYGVSNAWSVDVGFEKGVVSAGVGYDVEFSSTYEASYEVDVPAKKSCDLYLSELYNVQMFNTETKYQYAATGVPIYAYEYGTGWAQQFQGFDFRADIY